MHLASGATQDTIADVLSIDKKTLRKHYRRELDVGFAEMNAKVTGKLFNKCMEGDNTSIIWWDKTRNRMSEKQQVDHTSSDGSMSPQATEGALIEQALRLGIDPETLGLSGGGKKGKGS
jgi:methylphosphotriester-DNA--protein-cysteine methyltransferase